MAGSDIPLSDYVFAIICALPKELAAAKAMLDETYPEIPPAPLTQCAFTLGRIGRHNIVLASLPAGVYGTTSATAVVSYLQLSFPGIRYGLMVGIGGGVPKETADIRLGDVVVSKPTDTSSGVVQYDFGKTSSGGHFQPTGTMNQPPTILLTAITQFEARWMIRRADEISRLIAHVLGQHPDMEAEFSRPQEADHLFEATYEHAELGASCINCDPEKKVSRSSRGSAEPHTHYGIIASGNQVIKDAYARDRIAGKLNALCFEMEAAGIMNHLPCLVIRGICDYCDSHKNKQWQGYAALTAAAYAKLLLSFVPVTDSPRIQTMQQGFSILPFNRNPQFLGRDSEINRLEKVILAQNRIRKAAIAGLGGVGKTQIALELAYHFLDQNPNYSVFWIRSTNMEAVEKSFIDICDALGLPRTPSSDPKLQVKSYLSKSAGHWLLIVDNADDTELWMSSQSSYPTLKTILPQSPNGFTVFTTRNQKLATSLAGPQVIRVSELSKDLAMDLLRACLIEEDLMNDSESAKILVHQLGGLPLALIQAASFINQNLISLKVYLSLLGEQEDTKVELLSEDFDDDYQYEGVQNPVSATWLISFEQICRADSLATEYLSRIACIDSRDIPLSIFPPNGSVVEQRKALGTLKAYSFISEMADVQFVNMHQLVHLATRNWLRTKGVIEDWTIRTGEYLSQIFPSDDPRNRAVWRRYLPHAQYILQSENFPWKTAAKEKLSQSAAQCLYADGRYREAATLFQIVLGRRTQQLEKRDPKILKSMQWLASTYGKLGQWKEARELEVQVMNTAEKMLSLEHLDILSANKNNRAGLLWDEGRFKEAEELLIQAVDMHKTVLGPEDGGTLTSMANLGSSYKSEGRWKEAEELFIEVVDTSKTVLGAEDPVTLTTMENLATTYSNQGRWKEGEELGLQVMNTRKTVLGAEHPDTLTSMANLAWTYSNQGRLKEAEELGMQVLNTRKEVLGAKHHDTLISLWNMAYTLKHQRRHDEAITLLKTCVQLQKQQLGHTHPYTIRALSDLEIWQKSFSSSLI